MLNTFFKDLKVIELASVLAGPAIGMFFAELGAKVIKVENSKTKGDITRHWKLPTEDKNSASSAYYSSVNWNKEVLMLDLKDEMDLNLLYQHIKSADIVISNFKEKSAQQLKVDYQSLKPLNPTLIFAHLKGFPDNDRVAFDIVLQAETGFLFMNGEPNRPPVRMPVALIDLLAAHQLKEAILVGLINRYKTGEGCQVSTSLYEAAVSSLANQATNWLMAQHIPQKMGTQHPNIAPYGDMFQTKDGKSIVLAIGTDRQFVSFCKAVELEELLTDERFMENSNRVIHRIRLADVIADKIQYFNAELLLNNLNHAKVPVGIIRNMQEVFEVDAAQSMILTDDENGKRVKTVVFEIE